jgi:hypothetical protein
MRGGGNYNLMNIIKTPLEDRNLNEEFYLMMYITTSVPFFHAYDKISIMNISRCLKL